MLENRTAVDLELTAMRKENVVRTFRLGTGREDWGVMTTEHYLRVVSFPARTCCSRVREAVRNSDRVAELMQCFQSIVDQGPAEQAGNLH